MGIETKLPIVVYTHTDMVDTWEMFFGQLQEFLPGFKVYVVINENHAQLSNYQQFVYDDSKPYTDRWKEILPQIPEETILFLHEDMVLFDEPILTHIERYYNLVNDGEAESIKMIYVPANDEISDIDDTLIVNDYSKFSIQPTLIKTKSFIELLESVGSLNIWDFEEAIVNTKKSYMVKLGSEIKRGDYHCDSIVLPYIATAINKGKWNMTEYGLELTKLFKKYNIKPFERGIV